MKTKVLFTVGNSLMWLPKLPRWAVPFERILSEAKVIQPLLCFASARPYAIFSVRHHTTYRNILAGKKKKELERISHEETFLR